MKCHRSALGALFATLLAAMPLAAQDAPADSRPQDSGQPQEGEPVTDFGINAPANYHLAKGDSIFITVQGEKDLAIKQTIDVNGEIRPVYIDRISLVDLTVREAEKLIEQRYVEEKYLRDPVVRISIASYHKKVVFLQGSFSRNGPFDLPEGRESMKLSDLVSYAGGLSPYAKSTIKVTRESGEVISVNIQSLLRREKNAPEDILIYPGDTLWVGEKIW